MQLPAKQNSIWSSTTQLPPCPSRHGDLHVDVAIVGGGITGLTTALLLKRAGLRVVVVTRGRIGGGATGFTSAHLTTSLDTSYQTLIRDFGEEGATGAASASREAIELIARISRELNIDCDFTRVSGYRFTEDPAQADELTDEAVACRGLGIEVEVLERAPLPFSNAAALRFVDQARFHPLAYLAGLARELDPASGAIFEQTDVLSYEDGSPCRLTTSHGVIEAAHVVLATHTPAGMCPMLQTRLGPYTTYVLAVRLNEPIESALWSDMADPYHYIRTFGADGRVAIIGGADHKTGQADDYTQPHEALLAYARERFPIERVEHRWSSQVFEPADGLPYIGRMPGDDNIYVSTGYSGTGLTFGTVGATVISDMILGVDNPLEALFSPTRVKLLASVTEVVKENVDVAWHLVADRLKAGDNGELADVPANAGRVVTIKGQKLAAYRNAEGRLHVMSATCSHMGCVVNWNDAQKTWDCPCHGGRFHATGEVLDGPPTHGLTQPKTT